MHGPGDGRVRPTAVIPYIDARTRRWTGTAYTGLRDRSLPLFRTVSLASQLMQHTIFSRTYEHDHMHKLLDERIENRLLSGVDSPSIPAVGATLTAG